jgi:Thioredoxin like C-terminal domain
MIYQLPHEAERHDGYLYAEGAWQAGEESMALAGKCGALVLPYHAASPNAVLAVSADPVDLRLGLKPPARLELTQDGAPLDPASAEAGVRVEAGRSYVVVDSPRMYELARNPDGWAHELRLDVTARGMAVFAFSFSTCAVPGASG